MRDTFYCTPCLGAVKLGPKEKTEQTEQTEQTVEKVRTTTAVQAVPAVDEPGVAAPEVGSAGSAPPTRVNCLIF